MYGTTQQAADSFGTHPKRKQYKNTMQFRIYFSRQLTQKQLLTIIACLGILARLVYSQFAENIIHPDEIIQYAEQAHKHVFGYGLEPWEYRFGVRSWFLPTVISTVLALLNQLGISEPEAYTKIIRLIASIASCSLIWSCYQITKNCFPKSRLGPLIASITAAFWIEILVYAPRATPEALASYALCAAIGIATKCRSSQKENLLAGILIGLAAGLRYQYLPPIAILSILYSKRQTIRQVSIFAIGILASSSAIAISDVIRWGDPLKPLVNNFKFNAIEGISATFGVETWHFYLEQLATSSVYLIAVIVAIIYPFSAWLTAITSANNRLATTLIHKGAGLTNSQILENRLIVAFIVLVMIVSHSAVPHKELRFTFATIPITLCLISGATSSLLERLNRKVEKSSCYAPKAFRALLTISMATLAATLLSHSWPNNHVVNYYKKLLMSSKPLLVTKYLRSLEGVTSVLRLDTSRGFAGGYYYLHLNSRLYGQQNINNIEPDQFYNYFSHVVLNSDSKAPANFQTAKRFPSIIIYSNNLIKSKDLLPLDGHNAIYNGVDINFSSDNF